MFVTGVVEPIGVGMNHKATGVRIEMTSTSRQGRTWSVIPLGFYLTSVGIEFTRLTVLTQA